MQHQDLDAHRLETGWAAAARHSHAHPTERGLRNQPPCQLLGLRLLAPSPGDTDFWPPQSLWCRVRTAQAGEDGGLFDGFGVPGRDDETVLQVHGRRW